MDAAQVVEEEVVGQPAAALAVAAVAEPGSPATATAPSPASRNEGGGGVLVEGGDQDLQGHLHQLLSGVLDLGGGRANFADEQY